MKDWTKTGLFLLVGGALTAAAVGLNASNRARPADTDTRVGQPLFEQFDPAAVKSLEVVARDPVSQEIRRFKVANVDGVWRIPSHHNYPAEAAKRLANCATALFGLDRVALAGRYTADQKRYGVIAPDSDEATSAEIEEIGQRIVLKDAQGEPIADLIVGKPSTVETETQRRVFEDKTNQASLHYVRRGDESATYVTNLNLDLSTRFTDWIEPDLLQIDTPEINRVVIDNYELQTRDELTQRGIVRRIGKLAKDRNVLTRGQAFEPWKLEGLNEATEQVNATKVNQIVSLLDEMKIAGVRPKTQLDGQPILTADLTINTENPAYTKDPEQFQRALYQLQTELMNYGFNLARGEDNQSTFYASHGEMSASTSEGVVYQLYFGETVKGDDAAIEIGTASQIRSDAPPDDGAADADAGGDAAADKTAADKSQNDENDAAKAADGQDANAPKDDSAADSTAKNRYLMVHVRFDPAALGPEPTKPVEPIEPTKPEGYEPAKAPETPPPTDPNQPEPPPEPPADDRPEEFKKYDVAMAEYRTAKQRYDLDLDQYNRDVTDYQERKTNGERTAKRLATRFAPWFYVITGSSMESLQIPRSELVQPKPADPTGGAPNLIPPPQELPESPDIQLDSPSEGEPAANDQTQEDPTKEESTKDEPTKDEPAKDEPKKDEPKKDEPPGGESKPDPPADTPPSADGSADQSSDGL